jgi:hypothetical protein
VARGGGAGGLANGQVETEEELSLLLWVEVLFLIWMGFFAFGLTKELIVSMKSVIL